MNENRERDREELEADGAGIEHLLDEQKAHAASTMRLETYEATKEAEKALDTLFEKYPIAEKDDEELSALLKLHRKRATWSLSKIADKIRQRVSIYGIFKIGQDQELHEMRLNIYKKQSRKMKRQRDARCQESWYDDMDALLKSAEGELQTKLTELEQRRDARKADLDLIRDKITKLGWKAEPPTPDEPSEDTPPPKAYERRKYFGTSSSSSAGSRH